MFNLNPSCCNLRPLHLVECKWRTAAHAHRLTSAISQDDPVRQARVIRPNLVLSKYVFIPACAGRRLVCWARTRAASLSGGLFRGSSPDAWLPLSVLLYGAPRPRRRSKLETTIREVSRCNYLAPPETWMWLCFGDLALIGEAGDVPRGCTDSLPRRGAKARARGRAEGFLRPRACCPGLASFLKGGRDEIQCGSLPPPSSLGTTVSTTRPGTTNPMGPAGPDGSFSVRILSGSFSLPGLFMFGETRVAGLEEQVSKCAGILEAQAGTPAPSQLGLGQALLISLSRAACGCSAPDPGGATSLSPELGGAC